MMTTIPEGYRVMVVDPAGNVIDIIQLGGMDLAKPLARASLVEDIAATLPRDVRPPR
jgi:hypothetical protein